VRAKKACRLTRDLGVNAAGVALVLDLLEERDAVLRRLAQYEVP
jgi:chaperone modulatory protein CbpM